LSRGYLQDLNGLTSDDTLERREVRHVRTRPLSLRRDYGRPEVFECVERETSNHEDVAAVYATFHFHLTDFWKGPNDWKMMLDIIS